jgi:hypothetical protein
METTVTVTRMEYDVEKWFRVPVGPILDEFYDGNMTAWAVDAAAVVLSAEKDVDPDEFDRFVVAFLRIADMEPPDAPVAETFLYVPNAYDGFQLMHLLDWDVEPEIPAGDIDDMLDTLAMAYDPIAVEPPVREVMTSIGLGSGVRVLRYILDGEVLVACVRYAFFLPLSRTILELRASSVELGGFMRMLDAMDEFVQGITEERG